MDDRKDNEEVGNLVRRKRERERERERERGREREREMTYKDGGY